MKDRSLDPHHLDVRKFARDAGALAGRWPLHSLKRLSASCEPALADAAMPPVTWQATGEMRGVVGGPVQVWLHLEVNATVRLLCQRCLLPLQEALSAHRSFLFVSDEAEAARLDEELDDDVMVLSRSLDVAALAEDELILALPLVPRHERCPEPLTAPADSLADADVRPNPFAALETLRRPSSEGS